MRELDGWGREREEVGKRGERETEVVFWEGLTQQRNHGSHDLFGGRSLEHGTMRPV